MSRNQLFFLIISLLLFSKVIAQTEKDSVAIAIDLRWKTEKLELNKSYTSTNDTLQLSLVKFYISNVAIEYNNGLFYKEKNSFHLIDIENEKSLQFLIPKNNNSISKVIFNIGIDSITSVSGAMSGDLDVTNAMYWAWQSGYINMKIEGKSSSCKTRKNAFQFHIGGYLKPNYALRNVNINCNNNNEILLQVDLAKLFDEIQLSETNSIMIPGKEAMKIADLSTKMFSEE
jgi:hypothetical protein